jgi:hypothetical protein
VSNTRRYRLYGMTVEVEPGLPDLPAEDAAGPADVRVWMGRVPADAFAATGAAEEPWYVSPRMSMDREPTVVVHRRADGGFRMAYADGCEYMVDASASRIACTWPPHYTPEDAATYLLGPVLGLVLRMRGVPSLHAGAVAINGRAVAVVGPAGAGKSTTTAVLAGRGHRAVADDVLAIRIRDGVVLAQPAYPHLRLWPDAVPTVLGPGGTLPPLTPNWDKRFMRTDEGFDPAPLPLRAIYVLAPREDAGAPRLEPMGAVEGMLALVSNAYVGWFPDRGAQAREARVFGRVAAAVPIIRAVPHTDPARLPRLCELMEDDVRHRSTPAPRRA